MPGPVELYTLDAAWAEAEAALPEGWQFELGRLNFDGEWEAFAKSRAFWEDDLRVPNREQQIAAGEGPTPAAALRALAEKLRAVR